MNNKLIVQNGRFPDSNTNEFISNINTNEKQQIGLISNNFPDYRVTVNYLTSARNFAMDGQYCISTVNMKTINDILGELQNSIYNVELVSVNSEISIIQQIVSDYFIEFLIILILISLCVFMSLIQYSISQLKQGTILLMHGYSRRKLIKNITLENT